MMRRKQASPLSCSAIRKIRWRVKRFIISEKAFSNATATAMRLSNI